MFSIVIPAYNEAAVIGRTLATLLEGAEPGECEILVVCNGCTDGTAARARAFGPAVTVLETPVAGKTEALNLGDEAARGFPRFYVDADVVVGLPVLRALAARLARGDVLVCSPTGRIDMAGAPWLVRQYFRVRSHLPSAVEGVGGSGVYGLSQAGRRRFARFPRIVADDAFVRFHFAPEERETVATAPSTVFAPRSLMTLIAVRSRIYFGNIELARRFPQLRRHDTTPNLRGLAGLFGDPRLWPGLAVYGSVCLAARLRARRRLRGLVVWHRDDTTRRVEA